MGQARLEHNRRRERSVVNDEQNEVNGRQCVVEELCKRSPDRQVAEVYRQEADGLTGSIQLRPGEVRTVKYENRPPMFSATHRLIMAGADSDLISETTSSGAERFAE